MNAKSLFAALPLALAALTSSGTAAATEIVLSPAGGGSFAGSFLQAANGLVIDDFSVSPLTFDATVSVLLSSVSGPVTFFTAAFFPDTPGEIDFQNLTNDVGGSFGFSAPVTASTPLTLRVFGAVTDTSGNLGGDGSYRITVTAAVPEPETWALLVAGLAGIGAAIRRRTV